VDSVGTASWKHLKKLKGKRQKAKAMLQLLFYLVPFDF
jgi:hypothetical protein